jgi:branched-chain amino acid transport system ATP-binding protein
MSLLAVDKLDKAFGGVIAAHAVSFTLEAGELLAVIGPNGAGKSTLFNMIGGQLKPDAGRVVLAGETITGLPPRAVWRKGLGRTFQVAQTFVSMSVAENVQMALMNWHGEAASLTATATRLRRTEALALLGLVGMAEAADRPISALAYGDVKRVELAIALAGEPKLLLMDEPTAGMAPKERGALMRLVVELARARNIGVLFTEHDMAAVFGHADRILVLMHGEVIASGTPDAVRREPRVREVYLGEAGARAAAQATGKAP